MISSELVAIFTRLQRPATRQAAARELAGFVGADHVIMFGLDHEIGIFLPADGMPQTLPQGARWTRFLSQVPAGSSLKACMPRLDGTGDALAHALCDAGGSCALVFLGVEQASSLPQDIGLLLPFLGARIEAEGLARAAGANALTAREASQRANELNAALDVNRRELQLAYQKAAMELEQRREAESKLRAADKNKDDFLAMLAHELRNPLAPISMAAQVLRVPSIAPARMYEVSEIIERQVSHMSRLLDDLLDVSRVTRGLAALSFQQLDFKGLVAHAIEQARPQITLRKHHLTVDLPGQEALICGDATRIVQVVTNLLTNAARYTPEGGEIKLTVAVHDKDVELTLRDNGIGIEPELLPHIFDLFTQGTRSVDRSQGGLGLGLALVHNLVERHGGTVSARSEGLGRGSEFVVSFPRVEADAAEPQGRTADTGHRSEPVSVLIVDDNQDAARTLALFLRGAGHAVYTAHDGAASLPIAADKQPRVIVLDIGLPDMDGYELARAIRKQDPEGRTVLIALTGYGQRSDKERALDAGFDHHMTKPVQPAVLQALLEQIARED